MSKIGLPSTAEAFEPSTRNTGFIMERPPSLPAFRKLRPYIVMVLAVYRSRDEEKHGKQI